jgi:hypothetical protein
VSLFKRIDNTLSHGYIAHAGHGITVEFIRHHPGEWNVYVSRNGNTQYWRTVENMFPTQELRDAYRARNVPYAIALSNAHKLAKHFMSN